MTIEEKWKIHHLAEDMSYRKYDSSQIRNSLSNNQMDRLLELLTKYGSIVPGFEKYLLNQWIAGSIIKLAVKAPRMNDSEAEFIKSLLNTISCMYSKQNQRTLIQILSS